MINSIVLEQLIRVQMDAGCSSGGRFGRSVSNSTCVDLAGTRKLQVVLLIPTFALELLHADANAGIGPPEAWNHREIGSRSSRASAALTNLKPCHAMYGS